MRRVHWDQRARDELLAIPSVDDAVSVDATVQHFARDSVGFVRHIEREGEPTEMRLYVALVGYYVVFHADAEAVYVWRVVRRQTL